MLTQKRRNESMLFNYETTSRTDYRYGEIKPIVKTVYKAKPAKKREEPEPVKYVHTLCQWKKTAVPFNMYGKPKEILRTDPRDVQQPYKEPEDVHLEEAIRTRPRLIITPALSIDAIDDKKTRDFLIRDVYTTTARKAMEEAVALINNKVIVAPFPGSPAPADPISLPKLKPPFVSPEWRMDSVSWDGRQLRAHCDATKEFWLHHKLNPCRPCDESAIVKTQRARLRAQKKKLY